MSGAHDTQASIDLSAEGGRRLERRRGVFVVDFARLQAGVEQQVVDQVLRRRVLRVDDGLALEVLDRVDVAAHDHAVAPRRPVDLLVDAGRGARVLHQPGGEQHHHVEGAPQDVALSGGKRVTRDHRVVDQFEVDLEAVLLEEHAVGVRREAVVGGDDRQPADPHVDREVDHFPASHL
jgi:hypothetical protein